jgi:hypothetical protein
MGTPLIVFAKQADNVLHILRANGEGQKNAAFARGHLTAALFFSATLWHDHTKGDV